MLPVLLSTIPVFCLSGAYFLYWFDPSPKWFISAHALSMLLQIEGFVLFFSIFILGLTGPGYTAARLKYLAFILVVALLFSFGFPGEPQQLFWLSLFVHLSGAIRASAIDRSRQALVQFASLPVLIGTGFVAYQMEIPLSAQNYPEGIPTGAFSGRLHGYAMFAWGAYYFAIHGLLHLLASKIKYPDNWEA